MNMLIHTTMFPRLFPRQYFTTNDLQYLGKYVSDDDTSTVTFNIFDDNGKQTRIESLTTLNVGGFREVECRQAGGKYKSRRNKSRRNKKNKRLRKKRKTIRPPLGEKQK